MSFTARSRIFTIRTVFVSAIGRSPVDSLACNSSEISGGFDMRPDVLEARHYRVCTLPTIASSRTLLES